ncbi:MAG: class I SAM-dependent methyltransferase [Candidatus Hodarchaeales archaeon]|jgi:ubiquinone/menaquinone biosynthesis C-methylase UbiE
MEFHLTKTYDLEDPELINVIDDLPLWSAPFGLKLLETITMRSGITILDLGSGMGFPLIELAKRFGSNSKVYGIDPWKAGINRIKQKIATFKLDNAQIIEGVAEKLPFEDRYFDLIVSNNGLNNVQDKNKSFLECYRVAKPGAQFVFTMNQAGSLIEFYNIYRETLKQLNYNEYLENIDSHIQSLRPSDEEIENLVENVGFKIKGKKNSKYIMRYESGTSMFNHDEINAFFLPPWKNCIPESIRSEVFTKIEEKLNEIAVRNIGINLTVPFVCYDCYKP